ncbi:MAG: glutamyl-tRNA reductase [Saprospiraceae bacterium]|nr:glutamyl-tRNA reductase [Saprospiraceae bacterium]
MLSTIHILTVSHKELSLDRLPDYSVVHHDEQQLRTRLLEIKHRHNLDELFYLNTCNRVLYLFVQKQPVDDDFINEFFIDRATDSIKHYRGEKAVFYLFQVASSIHSMVVGEREIITQLRTAYEQQRKWMLSGDALRLLIQHTIRAAKKVYAATKIGEKPVSVVSLAVQRLLEFKISSSIPIILVGAGTTNQLVVRHLTKKGFRNISVYNRSKHKAQQLVQGLAGKWGSLDDLISHDLEFGCLIACTGAPGPTVTPDLANKLAKGKIQEKIWIDLGLPSDIDTSLHHEYPDRVINLHSLQEVAKTNLGIRAKEICQANDILEAAMTNFGQSLVQRRIEKAFTKIPIQIRDIKEKALTEVFKRDLDSLDLQTKEVISKMMNYMEKKCISVPMKAAREANM